MPRRRRSNYKAPLPPLLQTHPDSLRTMERPSQIRLDNVHSVLNTALENTRGGTFARIGDEAVDLDKVADHGLD
ncbi:hypothetical protein BBP40_002929 [Aspergillus hancockii]|nr:hypothetical protein BBP40_002929 [Aspergillus hancockii]